MPEIRRAYKTELDPNDHQRNQLRQFAGAARWAWNQALAVRQRYYNETGVTLQRRHFTGGLLTQWKRAWRNPEWQPGDPKDGWLDEVSNYCFQSAIADLMQAFENFFDGRAKYPRFKSRHGHKSFRVYGAVRAEERQVRIPKIGWIRLKERGYLPTDNDPVSATVSERAGRWFVSFQIDEENGNGQATGEPVGVDLGLTDLAAASDGRRWEGPKALQNMQRKKARIERKLARQQKGSNRRERTKQRLAKIHWRISNIRENATHELTSALVGVDRSAKERPQIIAVEDLNVKGMQQNSHLARHISDAAWGMIRRQLEYKCEWWGVEFVVVNPAYTSQCCNACGCIEKNNRDGKQFVCLECGHSDDADVNAAKNIRDISLQQVAGKAPDTQNGRGGSDKTPQRMVVHNPAKRQSHRAEELAHSVASGATSDQSAARGGG